MSDHPLAPIPSGTVLLHIGAPKTGTTALQEAAAAQRGQLRDEGILYPGRRVNHRDPAASLLGHAVPGSGGVIVPPEVGRAMVDELGQGGWTRALVSAERFALGKRHQVEAALDALGDDVHVLLSLRNMYSYALSMWQQRVKNGEHRGIAEWMKEATSDGRTLRLPGSGLFPEGDGYTLVSRWATAVGPDRMTVLVVDPRDPGTIFRTVESLLDLPDGFFRTGSANRSLSAVEVELVRAVAANLAEVPASDRATVRHLMLNGVSGGIVRGREPHRGEGRIAFPDEAVAGVDRATRRLVQSIEDSGVRVVGSIEALSEPPSPGSGMPDELPAELPTDLALAALGGLYARASKQAPGGHNEGALTIAAPDAAPATTAEPPLTRRVLARARAAVRIGRSATSGAALAALPNSDEPTVLHIGVRGSASTLLQQTAANARDALLAHGVRYPGDGQHQGRALSALVLDGHVDAARRDAWGALRAEVAGSSVSRLLLSSTTLCTATETDIRTLIGALGPRMQAMLVLQPPHELLAERWERHIRQGGTTALDDFLREALSDSQQATLGAGDVSRWCRVLGAENVTVVVTSTSDLTTLLGAAEAALDLPAGVLAANGAAGASPERPMSAIESDVVLKLNARLAEARRHDPRARRALVQRGAIARMLAARTPRATELGLRLPPWAEATVQEVGRKLADEVLTSGARVAGRPETLIRGDQVAEAPGDPTSGTSSIPADLAVTLVTGMLTAALDTSGSSAG
ncbi:hypothetical protein [Demequina maris]|uniref:hypothetical protein n=1 Tax=Demequina maris TaxID=1638982 RepID=UPI0007839766|nr:hypothetical protein [Demequina maris]